MESLLVFLEFLKEYRQTQADEQKEDEAGEMLDFPSPAYTKRVEMEHKLIATFREAVKETIN